MKTPPSRLEKVSVYFPVFGLGTLVLSTLIIMATFLFAASLESDTRTYDSPYLTEGMVGAVVGLGLLVLGTIALFVGFWVALVAVRLNPDGRDRVLYDLIDVDFYPIDD